MVGGAGVYRSSMSYFLSSSWWRSRFATIVYMSFLTQLLCMSLRTVRDDSVKEAISTFNVNQVKLTSQLL
jgi:hypothetical protein